MLFENVLEANNHNMTADFFISLGSVARGVHCPTLRGLTTPDSLLKLLSFFRDLPVELHTSLKKCILERLDHVNISVETVASMGPQLLFDLQLGDIRQFSRDMMQNLVQILARNPIPFLRIPRVKQSLLMDRVVEELNLYTGEFSEAELDLLGEASVFVPDEIFMNVSRLDLKTNLWKVRGYCFGDEKQSLLGFMLTENAMFGDSSNWTSLTLDKLDRLIFFLSTEDIMKLPQEILILEKLETLFHSQQRWAESQLGAACLDNMEQVTLDELFVKQQILLQRAVGILDTQQQRRTSGRSLILSDKTLAGSAAPTCNSVRNTFPSAWTVSLLILMSDDEFTNCLELIGQDPHFGSFELYSLLERVKEIHGSAAELQPSVIGQLGRVATSLTEEELAQLDLSDLMAVMALGSVWEWSDRQLSVLVTTFLRVSRSAVAELDSVSLVALGHLICGIDPEDLALIDPLQLSDAVLWIGKLSLSCSEAQLECLARLLTQPQAFGEVSWWGEGEFTEIGSIAAGLPDIVLSALVKEQIEGLTTVAIAAIPPKKFAVALSPSQIRMFSYEQGAAVTNEQYNNLNYLQKKALSLVLTSWDKAAIDISGRSPGTAIYGSLVEVLVCVLCSVLHIREAANL
ncbi:stereocilin-like [Callorhinchus milii]|uniref:stereocilin-like n=1 Tax=Callorhinchus milii TaxID=7868 RepID=UPI001C3F5DCD|nr:stereocilin-like [Callorhinchus milii]